MEIVTYIFGSFWHWLGAFLMLAVIAQGLGGLFHIQWNWNSKK